MRDKDIVMTLFESLLLSFEYLMTNMEKILMKEFTMDYMMVHMMHELLKCKDKEPQNKDVAMVL